MSRYKYPATFTFNATLNTKSVYIYGSWDGYTCGYALARCNKTAKWNGTIKVPVTTVQSDVKISQTYWYHYEVDGIEHYNKDEPYIQELKTGRILNFFIIDNNVWPSKILETFPARGRSLSLSEIKSPMPTKTTKHKILKGEASTRESIDQDPK